MGEVVDHERTGLLIAPGDAAGLSAGVRRLLDDPNLQQRMRSEAVAGRTRFDRERMVRDIHALCAEAMSAWSDGPTVTTD
jgi:glycosyltransferase involved in cell wall biosynthesis